MVPTAKYHDSLIALGGNEHCLPMYIYQLQMCMYAPFLCIEYVYSHVDWKVEKQCIFCDCDESIDHCFLACPIALYDRGAFVECGICKSIPINLEEWIEGEVTLEGPRSRFCCAALLWDI
jgi:hypothetical protein